MALPKGQLWRHNQAGDLPGEGGEIASAALAQHMKTPELLRAIGAALFGPRWQTDLAHQSTSTAVPCGSGYLARTKDGPWDNLEQLLDERMAAQQRVRTVPRAHRRNLAKSQPGMTMPLSNKPQPTRPASGETVGKFFEFPTVVRSGARKTAAPQPLVHSAPTTEKPPVRKHLTAAAPERLIKAAKRGRYGERDATAVLLAFHNGLRVSELCGLIGARVKNGQSAPLRCASCGAAMKQDHVLYSSTGAAHR